MPARVDRRRGRGAERAAGRLPGQRASQAAALGAALQAGDAVRCGKLAHALKSASRSVGALALGQLCAELELAPSGGDGAAHHTRFAAAFSAAAAAIEAHLQSCKMAAT
jgi:HPt (histidine-containing phosphotransfer) domain-containing protein